MYTGTFTFMPADTIWRYDPIRNHIHKCPAHHQFEVNLMAINYPAILQMASVNQPKNLLVI